MYRIYNSPLFMWFHDTGCLASGGVLSFPICIEDNKTDDVIYTSKIHIAIVSVVWSVSIVRLVNPVNKLVIKKKTSGCELTMVVTGDRWLARMDMVVVFV